MSEYSYKNCGFADSIIGLNLVLLYYLMLLNFMPLLLYPSCEVWLTPLSFKAFQSLEQFKLLFSMLETWGSIATLFC